MASGPWVVPAARSSNGSNVDRLLTERVRQRTMLASIEDHPDNERLRTAIRNWLTWCDEELRRRGHNSGVPAETRSVTTGQNERSGESGS